MGSLGYPELLLIVVVLLLLFGGSWLARVGRLAGERAKRKVLETDWLWKSATGTEQEAWKAERAFGEEWAKEINEQYKDPAPNSKQAVVDQLGSKLCQQQNLPCPFSYRVIRAQQVNAFALPGGFVYLCEPLFDALSEEPDAIAFILAHETAHILLGHPRERLFREWSLRRAQPGTAVIAGLLKTLLAQGYSQEAELEADKGAVSLMAAAGFHSAGASRVLTLLGDIGPAGLGPLEYLSSHPPAEVRLKNLQSADPAC